MYQSLPHLSTAFQGGDSAQRPADPNGNSAFWISPDSSRAIRLIGVVCAMILGLAWSRGGRAGLKETSPPHGAAVAVPAHPGSPFHVSRLRSGSIHRSHTHPPAVPKIVLSNDPNDDGTSGDPDEDDDNETSKFLSNFDDTDAPIMAWCQVMAPCPITHECATVTCTAPPSSTLLTLQRLRC